MMRIIPPKDSMKKLLLLMSAVLAFSCARTTDVLIIGGGASGTAAGIQAARMGIKTVIAEESTWLGGMLTSAGVSAVDGNYRMRSGLYDEFVDALVDHYGSLGALQSGWVSHVLFEPHVGDAIFKQMAELHDLDILYETSFVSAKKISGGWKVMLLQDGKKVTYKARILIDGTELGDVAKAVGVPYSIGMDARSDTGEAIALEQANDIVQDLTMCMILKDYGPGADKTIEKPEDYNPELYYNCAINPHNVNYIEEDGKRMKADTKQSIWDTHMMLTYGKLPVTSGGAKYMINWPVDANDVYVNIVDATPERRKEALDSCKRISLGFLYFLQTELGRPNLGLADDEFPTPDLLPFIPYHRESRRIDGMVRFTMDDAAEPFRNNLYRTALGSGTYPVDHHHYRNPEWMKIPHLYFYPIPSFGLPAGVVLPKEVKDFIVAEKSVSVTNLINGTTRLQPVVLQIGQASGALAALAVLKGIQPREVSVRDLQDVLLEAGMYIMPYNDLDNDDPRFAAVQRIGATGILRGEGKPIAWENQTWFHIDDDLLAGQVFAQDYYDGVKVTPDLPDGRVSVASALEFVSKVSGKTVTESDLSALGIRVAGPASAAPAASASAPDSATSAAAQAVTSRPITRCEFAVLLDALADPFHAFPVDWNGDLIR